MEQCFPKISRATVVLLFIFFLTFTFLVSFSRCVDPTYINNFCNSTLYPSNGKYQSNLNTLLSSLSSLATSNSNNAYDNATAGNIPNAVFGHYYCRGDVTHDICRDCVNFAAKDIVNRCPKAKFGTIWYDECTLRYSNHSFFSVLFESATFVSWNVKSISDPKFKQLLFDTANEVATEAASNSNRFATKEATFTKFENLYCLAQCSPDLSASDCNKCLVDAIYYLPSDKQGGRTFNPSCNIRFEVYPFYRVPTLPPAPSPSPNKLAPSPTTSAFPNKLAPSLSLVSPPASSKTTAITENRGSSSTKIVSIIVPAVGAGVIIVSILLYCLVFRKKKEEAPRQNGENEITSVESLQVDFDTIVAATNNFADANHIGQGGFGAVHLGKLPNGQEIAVKRLSKSSGQGAKEFKNEVALVARLQHRNLVKLLGFCLEREEKILIYEFVPNKSLDYFLFDTEKRLQLDWQKRHKIIHGIARGCLYLHEDSCLRIIHRDLKASNVLLDEEMNPKISDFGIARISGIDQTQQNTSRIVGTYGYMSPEYALHGLFSVKSDVFSFGVLVLEIVSGKKNSNFHQTDFAGDLISYAWRHWNAGTTLEFIDPLLREKCSRSEVTRSIHVALLCVQEDAADRPTMANIVLMLSSESVTLPLPSQPAFYVQSKMESDTSDESKSSRSIPLSLNEDSISFEGNNISR